MTDDDRRRKWAQAYLRCDPVTGEPGYQELITVDDLVLAMEAEAEHQKDTDD